MNEATKSRLETCFKKYGPGIVVLGDSHGMDLFNALSFNAKAPVLLGLSQGGCRPHDPLPKCHYAPLLSYLRENAAKIGKVIYVQAGRYLLMDPQGEPITRLKFEEAPRAPDSRPHEERIKGVAEYLRELSRYTNVVWLGPRIEPHVLRRFSRPDANLDSPSKRGRPAPSRPSTGSCTTTSRTSPRFDSNRRSVSCSSMSRETSSTARRSIGETGSTSACRGNGCSVRGS